MSRFSYYMEMAARVHSLKIAPKFCNYAKYKIVKRRPVMAVKRYTPQIASILLTMRCNLNCGYCNVGKIQKENLKDWREKEVNLSKVQRIFNNPLFANCILVDLLGGEPLLLDDLESIVEYLSKRGHILNTSTNGLLLSDRISGLKKAGISRINVSIYEANRSILEKEMEKINRIFPVHTSIVLLRSKLEKEPDKIIDTARFLHDTGSLSLRFFMYRPMGLNPQFNEIVTDSNQGFIDFKHRMESLLPGFCLWPAPVYTGKMRKLCSQLWQRVGVCDALGNMGICCGVDDPLSGPNSNLFDADPDIVFNHPTFVEMREKLLDPDSEPPEACKTCNLLADPGW